MTTLQLIREAAATTGLLYVGTITISAITALATSDPDQRRTALQVLALLLRGNQAGGSSTT